MVGYFGRRMWALVIMAGVVYGGMLGYLYSRQRQLIYHPVREVAAPQAYGLSGFTEQLIGDYGAKLQYWIRPAAPGFPTIMYFHGNAANLSTRAPIFAELAGRGFGVVGLSYRGYGKSDGTPSEDGIFADARAAIALAHKEMGVPYSRMIFYGESLGSGVAVRMAGEHQPGALVLEAAYTSVANRAAELYPYIPVKWLLKDHFDSMAHIGRVRSPVLMFHGELDETIPVAHGRALLAAANEPKQAFFFPDIHHNDFDNALISDHVLAFAHKHGLVGTQ
ncbi:MAG: alpha/beta hydrolase [Alphaproteobacteria bacterium]|nr:alpha/beta hydrolase [Alphaproteobacteria bacterium]